MMGIDVPELAESYAGSRCGEPMAPTWAAMIGRHVPPPELCRYCRAEEQLAREAKEARERVERAGVAKRHMGMSFDNPVEDGSPDIAGFEATCRGKQLGRHAGNGEAFDVLRRWTPAVGSVYLHGPPGSGKTCLAEVAAIRLLSIPMRFEMVEERDSRFPGFGGSMRRIGGHSVLVASEAELLSRVKRRRSFGASDEEPPALDAAKRVETLVLDDLGCDESAKGGQRSQVGAADVVEEVLDARYRAGLTVIATSNWRLEQLHEVLGRRVVSRLTDMCGPRVIAVRGSGRESGGRL